MNPQTDRAAAIVEQYGCKTENLIAILQDIQAAYNYLSEANLTLVADRLGISVSKVYSVATFYENFSLEAKGRHIIKVCAGTACHVRKSGPIYDAIYEYLGLSGKRRTSDDGMFTLETVACLGACGLADAPYMEPVRTYCAALQDDDFTRLQEAIPPAVLNADGFDAGELANVRDSFAKGSSNDYDITPKELDSRRIPESGCRVLEDYFRQQYDWTMTVDEARLVKFRVSFTGELDGQLNVRAVCYQTGGHWYLDLSAVNLNLFS